MSFLAHEAVFPSLVIMFNRFKSGITGAEGGYGIFFFFFCLLSLDIPRLRVGLELQLPTYTTATATQDLTHVCDLHRSS